jgi:hypothetical protein
MNSFIDEYNKKVELDCIKKMKSKTLKVNRDYLASNRVYNKELGGFVAPDLLTNKQFKNTIKNIYEYLGQKIPNEPELEDLYVKAFNDFTEEQYIDFMNLVFLGGFDNIQDAYKSFTKNLQEPEILPLRKIDITEGFSQYYPPVGSEALYGFARSGRREEMAATTRYRVEVERRKREYADFKSKYADEEKIFIGEVGRPKETILEGLPTTINIPRRDE